MQELFVLHEDQTQSKTKQTQDTKTKQNFECKTRISLCSTNDEQCRILKQNNGKKRIIPTHSKKNKLKKNNIGTEQKEQDELVVCVPKLKKKNQNR